MGELISIAYKPAEIPAGKEGYARIPLQQAQLIAGFGIEGDTKGGGDTRNLNIMSAETLSELAQEGFQTDAGKLGEQLIFTGIAVDALPIGSRLQIGKTACVEVTEPRTGCVKFEGHQGKLRQEASGRLGIMARVVQGGLIAVGDTVNILEATALP